MVYFNQSVVILQDKLIFEDRFVDDDIDGPDQGEAVPSTDCVCQEGSFFFPNARDDVGWSWVGLGQPPLPRVLVIIPTSLNNFSVCGFTVILK